MVDVKLGDLPHFVSGPCTFPPSQSQLTSSPEGEINCVFKIMTKEYKKLHTIEDVFLGYAKNLLDHSPDCRSIPSHDSPVALAKTQCL